ncbi:MAG: gamma-glutamylcyclotransferase family protein [Kordiimonas sp.]
MNVFFYGLFMDREILRSQGLNPQNEEQGFVEGYQLQIGERALLKENSNERAYGVLFSLKETEVEQLYAAPSVQDYQPIDVSFTSLATGESKDVQCYNLHISKVDGSNPEYVTKLCTVLTSLGFPSNYIKNVLAQAG